jgi:hypothetical protein
MKAVLVIATAGPVVGRIMSPHIDSATESIDWEPIFLDPGNTSGTRALITWAYSLWTNELRGNPFEAAHSLDEQHRLKLIEAIKVWLEIDVQTQGHTVQNSNLKSATKRTNPRK